MAYSEGEQYAHLTLGHCLRDLAFDEWDNHAVILWRAVRELLVDIGYGRDLGADVSRQCGYNGAYETVVGCEWASYDTPLLFLQLFMVSFVLTGSRLNASQRVLFLHLEQLPPTS
jgi:hypothetical protein